MEDLEDDYLPDVKINIMRLLKLRKFKFDPENSFFTDRSTNVDFVDGEKTYSFNIWIGSSEFPQSQIQRAFGELADDENATVFLIYIVKLTPDASKELFSLRSVERKARIELWSLLELFIYPFDHYLVPEHRIMTEDEIEKAFPLRSTSEKHRISRNEFFARIPSFSTDIIVKWLGAKPGQIIEIKRKNMVLDGNLTSYRMVRGKV